MINKLKKHVAGLRSLNAKMLATVLTGLFAGVAVFLIVYYGGRGLVNGIYMSSDRINRRKSEIYADFNAFVSDRRIKGSDSAAVAEWTEGQNLVTILVFDSNGINFRAQGGRADIGNSLPSNEMLKYSEQYGKLYPVRFADGSYRIAIIDNTQTRQYTVYLILALALAFSVFLTIILRYTGRLTERIISLSAQAAVIGGGDLEAPIEKDGSDELAELAGEIDSMRNSVIEKMSNEKEAWQANSDLITAISHDIRTPMTSLLGYLGLLSENSYGVSEQDRAFVASAYGKALELKDLTDELFRYFLIFGKTDVKLDLELFDAPLLIDQLLSEAQFDLIDMGFEVERDDCVGQGSVQADALYLKRVTDNFISNIKKYADRSYPIELTAQISEGHIHVSVSNRISLSANKAESNKIGLRTCKKIMELMGGGFSAGPHGNHFIAEFSLPVIQDQIT